MFAHDHLAKIYGPLSFIFSFVCARPFARSKIRVAIDLFLLFAHNHSSKIYGSLLFILSFVHLLFLWFSSNYFFYLHAATWPKYMILFCLFYFNLYKAMRSVLPLYSVHYIQCWLMMSSSKFLWNYSVPQLVAQGEQQEVSPALFWKKKKRVLILQKTSEKSTLYVCIDRLNSNLECSFKGFFEKTLKFFPAGRLFVFRIWNVYRSACIRRNLPWPEKFPVAHCHSTGINRSTLSKIEWNLNRPIT